MPEESVEVGDDEVTEEVPVLAEEPPAPPAELTPPSQVEERWNQCAATQHTSLSLIFELIDNSIQHRSNSPLRIHIILKESDTDNKYASEIEFIDNGKGIDVAILPKAFTMNGMAGLHGGNGISEHGVGMKHALRGLSKSPSCQTRTTEDNYRIDLSTDHIKLLVNGNSVTEPVYTENGEISYSFNGREAENFSYTHGTKFTFRDLEHKGGSLLEKRTQKDKLDSLIRRIGQRYRYFLGNEDVFGPDSAKGIRIYRLTKTGKLKKTYPIEITQKVNPLYGENRKTWAPREPLFKDHPLHTADDEWEATITIGTAPRSKEEWETCYPGIETGKDRRHSRDPYAVKQKNAGIDLVFKNLVMNYAWLKSGDIGLEVGARNVSNYLRGELKLKSGFKTPQDKVTVTYDENFDAVISRINDIIRGRIQGPDGEETNWWDSYIKWDDGGPRSEPEEKIVNGYKYWLDEKAAKPGKPPAGDGLPKTERVGRKYSAGWGEADLNINGSDDDKRVIIEVKAENCRAQHVFQLFMYMRRSKTRYGILVGPKFSPEATQAAEWIMENEELKPEISKIFRGITQERIPYKIHFHIHPTDGGGGNEYYSD